MTYLFEKSPSDWVYFTAVFDWFLFHQLTAGWKSQQ